MSGGLHPLAWSMLVDYWAGDLTPNEQDAVDEHLMGCADCTQLSAAVASIAEALRTLIPPLLKPEWLPQLAARGLRIVDNPMLPGERREVHFPAEADILLHRLGGLALMDATRVGFVMRVESSGVLLAAVDDAPFDREHGCVLVACQKHYAAMPPDTVAEVRVFGPAGHESSSTYTILHRFA